MANATCSRRTPDMEDIFATEVQGYDAPGPGTCTESGSTGRRTPDLDDIFKSDVADRDNGIQWIPQVEGIVDCRGMDCCKYSTILKC